MSVRLLGVGGLDGLLTGILGSDTDLTGGSSFTELKEEVCAMGDVSLLMVWWGLDRRDTEENPFSGGITLWWPAAGDGRTPGRSELVVLGAVVRLLPPHHALPWRLRLAIL